MKRCLAFLLVSALVGCSRSEKPCSAGPHIQETTVLIATIMTPNGQSVSYQSEFSSMASCEIARQELRAEMDRAAVSAKNAELDERAPQQGRAYYHGIYHSFGTGYQPKYPDLVAICADHAVSSGEAEQQKALSPRAESEGLQGEFARPAADYASAPEREIEPTPPPVPILITPIPAAPTPPNRHW